MGIRVKNQSHYILRLACPGTLTAAANKDVNIAPFAGKITNIYAAVLSGGTGVTNSIADVNINGTTIFSQAPKITITSTSGTIVYSTLSSQPTNVAAGDMFTLDLDSVGTSVTELCVLITITRSNVGAESNVADHDTIF
jgi:hypothetical protein